MKPVVPVKVVDSVIHVGHMDVSNKSESSHEGKCLSVSECPDAWVRIAKLGGLPWNRLTKKDAKFLDYHKLIDDKESRQALYQWATKRSFIEVKPVFVTKWHDDEFGCDFQQYHSTREKAEEELGEIEGTIREIKRFATPTDTAVKEAGFEKNCRFVHVHDILTILLAEEQGLDGVWWDDDEDPDRLSAPRGGILPKMVPTWKVKKVKVRNFD